VKYSSFNKLPGLIPKADKENVLHTQQAKREQDADCGLIKTHLKLLQPFRFSKASQH